MVNIHLGEIVISEDLIDLGIVIYVNNPVNVVAMLYILN